MWVIFAVPFDLASGRGRTWSGLAIPSGATRLRCTAEGLRSQRQGSIQSANRLCCLAVIVGAIPTALVLAILAVQVESPACPSRAEVEQALRPMLPALPEAKQGDMARIARVGRGLPSWPLWLRSSSRLGRAMFIPTTRCQARQRPCPQPTHRRPSSGLHSIVSPRRPLHLWPPTMWPWDLRSRSLTRLQGEDCCQALGSGTE